MVFSNNLLMGAAGAADGGYTIDQSIRFNDNDSAYLSRTSGATGDRQKWTFSAWVKRGNLSSNQRLFHDSGNTNFIMFGYSSNNEFRVYLGADIRTTALFRDPSAWYHLVVAVDTTQATSSDRVKIYQNGVQITSFSTAGYPSLNYNTIFNNSGTTYQISGQSVSEYFDGYISEFHWIDGQALDPTDFGEYNDDGVWVPKAYAGTYGTNGFYITGEDSADLGKDYSGNGNDFTSSGLTSDDQRGDTPTLNYPTISPISVWDGPNAILSEGNLRTENNASTTYFGNTLTMQPPQTGKWYFESSIVTAGQFSFGIEATNKDFYTSGSPGQQSTGYAIFSNGAGTRATRNNNTNTNTRTADTAGDVFQIAMDCDEGEVWLGRNNTWYGGGDPSAGTTPTYTFDAALEYAIVLTSGTNGNGSIRYVQGPDWTYTAPTAFKELNTANLPTPAIKDGSAYFQTTTYTGAGYPTEVNQSGNSTFQPDFVWIKRRNAAVRHDLFDAVRGGSSILESSDTRAENIVSGALTFDSDGFTAAADPIFGDTGSSGNTFVGWQWLAANGTASNTDGTITSTVSANTTAGFSIVRAASMAGAGGTIGHGLSQAPDMVIGRMQSEVFNWWVWHQGLSGGTYSMKLNDTSAQAAVATVYTAEPTSTVINTGASWTGGNPAIFYCFHEVEGFSKFGKYTGNGSADGSFIYTGFSPAFVIIKCSSVANSWTMYDTTRQPYNANGRYILAESTAAEVASTTVEIDILSNGFKARDNQNNINGSGRSYIYLAFAEHPFGGTGVAPVPAR